MAFPIAAVPAIISAVAGLASAGINAGVTVKRNKMQIAENEKAFAREQAAIREQNAYNSPAQQVARLAAAGLSPQMAYGNGDIVSSTQNDVPSYSPAQLEAPQFDFSSAVASAVQVREQFNRNSLAKSLKAVQDSQVLLNTSASELNNENLRQLVETFGFKINEFEKNLRLLDQESQINDQTIEKLRIENGIKTEILSQEEWNTLCAEGRFDLLMIELDINREQLDQMRALFPAKLALMDSESALNWVKSSEASANISAIASLAAKYDQEKYESAARERESTARAAEQEAETASKTPAMRRERYRNETYGGQSSFSVTTRGISVSQPSYQTRQRDQVIYYKTSKGLVGAGTR